MASVYVIADVCPQFRPISNPFSHSHTKANKAAITMVAFRSRGSSPTIQLMMILPAGLTIANCRREMKQLRCWASFWSADSLPTTGMLKMPTDQPLQNLRTLPHYFYLFSLLYLTQWDEWITWCTKTAKKALEFATTSRKKQQQQETKNSKNKTSPTAGISSPWCKKAAHWLAKHSQRSRFESAWSLKSAFCFCGDDSDDDIYEQKYTATNPNKQTTNNMLMQSCMWSNNQLARAFFDRIEATMLPSPQRKQFARRVGEMVVWVQLPAPRFVTHFWPLRTACCSG